MKKVLVLQVFIQNLSIFEKKKKSKSFEAKCGEMYGKVLVLQVFRKEVGQCSRKII